MVTFEIEMMIVVMFSKITSQIEMMIVMMFSIVTFEIEMIQGFFVINYYKAFLSTKYRPLPKSLFRLR